ncbi:MAG: hypothetical protein JWS10_692 [Cypionkella sp.]|uniref:DUF4365 domain-containing protein n=1 Tax=Cypionkella sp. TaxID=2811411 RepID=UPI00261B9217|nr:DUF4365 domain-containing protein [Cypionkella sp.]MDB5658077.1 hypothetical protein [Cypionkella sp.]
MPLPTLYGMSCGQITRKFHEPENATTRTDGVNAVEKIVLAEWNARWQPLEAHNDDAVDGLIFLERDGELSGQIIFTQVKCVKAKKRSDGKLAVSIAANQLARNLAAWRKVVGAAIVVLVDPDDLSARWVDIRPSDARTSAQILVPGDQMFDRRARKSISQLCGTLTQDLQAQKIHTFAGDFPHLRCSEHVQQASRSIYKSMAQTATTLGRNGERVHFDREGWRHITRPGRSELSRYQSFVLLGAARKIIEECVTPPIISAAASATIVTSVYFRSIAW